MSTNNPLVSIVIPTYSRPNNLCRAIESVLHQTYHPIEIIVVDDNGEGTIQQCETESLLAEYIQSGEIVYIKHPVNKNGSAARNTGVKYSHGQYIGLLDDDDVFLPQKVEEQINCLSTYRNKDELVKGCYCNVRMVGYHRKYDRISSKQKNLTEDLMLGRISFNSSTILIEKSAYQLLGGFDERYKRQQDREFCLRYLQHFKFVCACPDHVLLVKYQTSNVISRNPKKSVEYLNFFIDNFRELFDSLPQSKAIYAHLYSLLACILIRGGFRQEGVSYFKKAMSYKMPKLEDCLHFAFSFFVNR